MRSREVSPRFIAVAVLATLAAVLALYWRFLLVDKVGPGSDGGGGPTPPAAPVGQPLVTVSTLAGRTTPGCLDGPAAAARFNGPSGIAVAPGGALYVSDSRNHRIRRIDARGVVSTVAGSGPVDTVEGGYRDGPALDARFRNPTGLAVAADGTLYVADAGNHCIRALRPDGRVTTVAGRPGPPDEAGLPSGGYLDGPAARAHFAFPTAVAVDGAGGLVVADTGNACIRRIAPDGRVSTLAGRPGQGCADGPGAAARFRAPTALARDPSGSFYVADAGNRAVRVVAPSGETRTLPTQRMPPPSGASDWTVPAATSVPAPEGPRLVQPTAAALDGQGRLLVCDAGVGCLYLVAPADGTVLLLAGAHDENGGGGSSDGPGGRATFARPAAIAAAPDGAFYVADFGNNCVRRVMLPAPGHEADVPVHPRRGRRWRDLFQR